MAYCPVTSSSIGNSKTSLAELGMWAATEVCERTEDVGLQLPKGRCRPTTAQRAHGEYFPRVSCVKTAGIEFAQRFWHIAAFDESIGMREGLELTLNLSEADRKLFGLSITRQILILLLAAERGLAKRNGVAGSDDARGHDRSTDFHEEWNRLFRTKVALCSGLAEIDD